MIKRIIAAIVAAVALFMAVRVGAEEPNFDTMAHAIRWAEKLTGEPIAPGPIQVIMVPLEILQFLACGGPQFCPNMIIGGLYADPGETMGNLITADGRTIWLNDTLEPNTDLYSRSILIHELIHLIQSQRSEFGGPVCLREKEAYRLQDEYLEKNGGIPTQQWLFITCQKESQ